MIRLVTRGRFTHDYLKCLLAAPEDREAPVRQVIEAAGGKVISFYVTTGETDLKGFQSGGRVPTSGQALIAIGVQGFRNSSGNFAIFAAIRRALSLHAYQTNVKAKVPATVSAK